jgi:hypothetical protein
MKRSGSLGMAIAAAATTLSLACTPSVGSEDAVSTVRTEMTTFGQATVTRVASEDSELVQWCISVGQAYAPDSSLCTMPRRSSPVDDGGDGLIADIRARYDDDISALGVAMVLTTGDVVTAVDCKGDVESLDIQGDLPDGTVVVRFYLVGDPECERAARIVATQGDRRQEVVGST